MREDEIDEIEALFIEERIRGQYPKERYIYVPPCRCGMEVDLRDPGLTLGGDLDAVPPRMWVICPRCGAKIDCEVIGQGGRA